MNFSIIVAVDQKLGIGINNQLPWDLKKDLKHFSDISIGNKPRTTLNDKVVRGKKNAVIMGLNTWLSLPEKFRPLKDRLNVVLSLEPVSDLPSEVLNYLSLESALADLEKKGIEEAFIIGGGMLYKYAISQPECNKLYITEIQQTFDCDIFFPKIPDDFKKTEESEIVEEDGIKFKYVVYER